MSWAYAPGYVSWCPLGWNNRAVFGFNVGVYGGYRSTTGTRGRSCRISGFGRGYVNANVVNSTRIDVRTRNSFVVRDAAPDHAGYAVPRSSAPIRSVGVRGVPSSGGKRPTEDRGARLVQRRRLTPIAAAAFRSRRSSSASLNGTGYPAPAREPRSMSTLPAPTRQGVSRSRDAVAPTAPAGRPYSAPESRPTTAPAAPSDNERRAVPRYVGPSGPADGSATPSRRVYQTTPESNSPAYSPGTAAGPTRTERCRGANVATCTHPRHRMAPCPNEATEAIAR